MKAKLAKVLTMAVLVAMLFTTAASAQPASHITGGGPISLPAGVSLAGFPVRSNGTVDAMLELYAAPTTVTYAATLNTRHSQMLASQDAVSGFASILSAQAAVKNQLAALSPDVTVLYSVQRAYNGIAVTAQTSDLAKLAAITGVKAVHLMRPQVLDNSYSVPMIGAPSVWQMGTGNRGTGIKVGVIDTGVDYIHTNFGGPGTPAAYKANDTTIIGDVPTFPSVKVVGGYDFAGDAYNADSSAKTAAAKPDPDPMDCNGHGSHVAGTIGGYGVNADGTTYTGVYTTSTNFASLRIGPGVAPDASIYALRVFGCSGSTNLTTEAIDWAVDPNNDGDPSDHLDVINMSLGSSYGSAYTDDAIASDNASLAGVIVVAASGNDYDSHYITSTPASATRAISVAASTNPQSVMDGFEVTAPTPLTVYGTSNAVNGWTSTVTSVSGNLKYYAANPGACTALPAGTFTGFIALIDWTFLSDNTTNACGSSTRVVNAANAGAIGVLMVYQHTYLDISISGNAAAPSTITTLATGALIKTALAAGTVSVRLTSDYNGTIKNIDPAVKDMVASFSSRGPRSVDSFLKPDITAPGQQVFSTLALSGNKGVSEQGTSMATPHMAGVMALLRELHPSWTVEELKALVMNTATHSPTTGGAGLGNAYATPRVGAGRVDVANSSASSVIAYNIDNPGAVSVSFGDVQVPVDGKVDLTKNVVVTNKAPVTDPSATYTVAFAADPSLATGGVSFAVEYTTGKTVTSLTLAPGRSINLVVHMLADGSKMTHTMDKTMAAAEVAAPREYMTEAGGYITLTPTAGATQPLRLPVYAVAEPVSSMAATTSSLVVRGSSDTTTLSLDGVGINTGKNTPVDIQSLVSVLELKATNPDMKLDPTMAPGNYQYVGAMSDRSAAKTMADSYLFVGFSTFGSWNTPNQFEYDTWISTTGDGVPDYVAYTTSFANGSSATDVYVVKVVNLSTGKACADIEVPNWLDGATQDTAILNNNVMLMPISAACLGLTDANSMVTFGTVSWSNITGQMIDTAGAAIDSKGNVVSVNLPYDLDHISVDVNGGSTGAPIYMDLPGSTIPVVYNKASDQTDVKGLLLLHHMNAAGKTAEVVPFVNHPYTNFFPVIGK